MRCPPDCATVQRKQGHLQERLDRPAATHWEQNGDWLQTYWSFGASLVHSVVCGFVDPFIHLLGCCLLVHCVHKGLHLLSFLTQPLSYFASHCQVLGAPGQHTLGVVPRHCSFLSGAMVDLQGQHGQTLDAASRESISFLRAVVHLLEQQSCQELCWKSVGSQGY